MGPAPHRWRFGALLLLAAAVAAHAGPVGSVEVGVEAEQTPWVSGDDAPTLLERGKALARRGEYEGAAASYESALALDPALKGAASAHYMLALSLIQARERSGP